MAAQSELDVRVRGVDELSPELRRIESSIIRFVGAVSASLAAIRIGAAPIQAAADFERALADISKTTDFTGDRLRLLSDELLKLSQRSNVATIDLLKIAAAAGQQGLGSQGVEAIVKFTESVSRMAAVLDVTAEQAGTDIGKIVNVFRLPLNDVEKIVSAFNEVSNNSTATGDQLLDVVKRIGDAAGSLNLQQSLGLAASGIDFGVSPEVVGTSFSKVFAQMLSKASEFGKLMNMSATEWISIVQTDGIAAFKLLLKRLRELEPESQQLVIAKMIGGGRIGALMNKFVQDSANTVLDRNLQSGAEGFEGGISALKEQAKVLNTLTEQFNILKNNVFAIGKSIGDEALQPMTSGVARLSASLQSPAFQSFARAIGQGFARAVDAVVSMVEAVAELNVNWENFLKPLEFFLKLKFVEYMARGALTLLKWANPLQSIANNAAKAATETERLTAAQTKVAASTTATGVAAGFAARVLGIQQEIAAWKQLTATKEEARQKENQRAADLQRNLQQQSVAQTVVAAQQRQIDAAAASIATSNRGRQSPGALNVEAGQAAAAAKAASANYRQALQAAQAAEAALEARRQTSLQQKEQAHIANMTAIQQAYETRKAEIKATGTRVGLTALERETAALRAEEERRHAQSLSRAEQYWARQVAIAQAGAAATLNAQKQVLANANAALDTKLQERANAQATVIAATAARDTAQGKLGDLKSQEAALQQATQKMGLWTQALAVAGVAWTTFTKVVAVGARFLMSAFTWVTLIFTLLDAFGLLDGVGAILSRIGESLGLVSKQKAEAAAAAEAHKRALEEETARIQEQTSAYEKLKDASGAIDPKFFETTRQALDSGTPDEVSKTIEKIGVALTGAEAQMQDFQNRADQAAANLLGASGAEVDKATAKVNALKKEIEAIGKPKSTGDVYALAKLESDLAAAVGTLEGLKSAAASSAATVASLGESVAQQAENMSKVGAVAAQAFTDQTLKIAEDILIPMAVQKDLFNTLESQIKSYNQQLAEAKTDEAKKKIQDLLNETIAKAQEAGRKIGELRGQLASLAQPILALPENAATAAAKNSVVFLQNLQNQTGAVIRGFVNAGKEAQAQGTALTGAAVKNIRNLKGSSTFDPKTREGAEKRLATAKVEAARQAARDEINILKATAQQEEEVESTKYERGLTSLESYWDRREQTNEALFDAELRAKKQEENEILKQIAEAKKLKDAALQVNLQKDLGRVRAEAQVLETQFSTESEKLAEARRRAMQQYENQILQDSANFMKSGLSLATPEEAFNASLAAQQAAAEQYIQRLRTQAQSAGTQAARDTAQRALNELQARQVFQAIEDSLKVINDRINIAFSGFDQYVQKLQMLRNVGLATTAEVENATRAQIGSLSAIIDAKIVELESRLAILRLQGAEGTVAYQQLQQQLEGIRLKLLDLKLTADQTALSINKSMGDAIANGLGKMEPTLRSVRDTLLGIIRDIASNVQQTIAKAFSEQIMLKITGDNPAGGLGGLIAGALGKNFGQRDPLGGKGTIANPMITKDWKIPGLGGSSDPTAPVEDAVKKGGEGILDSMITGAQSFLSTIQSGLTNVGSMLMDLFSSIFSSMGGGGGGGGGGFLSAIFSAFGGGGGGVPPNPFLHTGGYAGDAAVKRFISPAVFQNAQRYHNGGIAGLKPNEVPTILEQGEKVITKRQQEAAASGGVSSIRNVLVTDANFVPDALQSPQGEKVLMTFIRSNRATIAQMLGGR